MSNFLNKKILDKLVAPLMQTFKIIFITAHEVNEKKIQKLYSDENFKLQFEEFVKSCLTTYMNSKIELSDVINNIIYEYGVIYNYLLDSLNQKELEDVR